MTDRPRDDQDVLSEELAHRLLTRAVEIDTADAGAITIARLREVATDVGIAPSAFDRALAELQREVAGAPVPQPTGWLRATTWFRSLLRNPQADQESFLRRSLHNAASLGVFALAIAAASGLTLLGGLSWKFGGALRLLATIAAVAVAHRLRAKEMRTFLALFAAVFLAEYAVNLWYGVTSLAGAAGHFAVLLAAWFGFAVANVLRQSRTDSTAKPEMETARSSPESSTTSAERPWSLSRRWSVKFPPLAT